MENISIFDFIGSTEDDLYIRLQEIQIGERIVAKGYEVRLTDKFYEIENAYEHLGFKTLDDCYKYLNTKKTRFNGQYPTSWEMAPFSFYKLGQKQKKQ